MNKPVLPRQLDLMPDAKPVDGSKTAAILAATGWTPTEAATVEAIIAAPSPTDDGFDWNDATDEDIIVKPRPGIAVYRNKADNVVIRVQNTSDAYDEDHFAFIRPDSLPALIKALKDELP